MREQLNSWHKLEKLVKLDAKGNSLSQSVLTHCDIEYDYSRQQLNQPIFLALLKLADECDLELQREKLLTGKKVNISESRAALHTALRAPFDQSVKLHGHEVAASVKACLSQMKVISQRIRHRQLLGYSGKPIDTVVNIGMGGSDLGPRMSNQALKHCHDSHLKFRFLSDACPTSFDDTTEQLNPETTLFIVSSKSFSTQETLLNAKKAFNWINNAQAKKHFIAVTAEPQKAISFGIETILPMWDWVGGRFSLCSSINLILMLAIGDECFLQMLQGANDMDNHFSAANMNENMPVIMAMAGIWNINFKRISSHAVLVYNSRLKDFPAYLQQLEMESNGKSHDQFGNSISHATCPIVWGGIGNQIQHTYYQLLSQGTQRVAIDFIFDATLRDELTSKFGQTKATLLSQGDFTDDIRQIEGNHPINCLTLKSLSPYTLGALVALYEHKVFVHGCIWGVNSFDQFGVESSKKSVIAHENVAI